MTDKARVKASSTHFPNSEKVKVSDSEFGTENHQEDLQLIDPEDESFGSTHFSEAHRGIKKAPVKANAASAPLIDEELKKGGPKGVNVNSQEDPAIGYLEKQAGMPVINTNPVEADLEDEFADEEFEGHSIESDFEDLGEEDEFEGHDIESSEDELEGEPLGIPEEHSAEDLVEEPVEAELEAPEEFEEPAGDECVALVDADEVKDADDHELQFATIGASVHVIRSNRIVASLGRVTANKAGIGDIYLTPQYQDVVAANVEAKGLRKGLVQSGFVLAKVNLTASKANAKVISAKVEKQLAAKVQAAARREQALEQSLAIAAVGINRKFFKGAENELKAGLETELQKAGVRGGSNIVRAMFAQHGVSYAKAILTLANKISEMPEEVRNQYADALDLTNDEDFEHEEIESGFEDEDEIEEEHEDLPSTVSAALSMPLRRDRGALLSAGVKSSAAMAILAGNQSLV
jgi:hypothetical protein